MGHEQVLPAPVGASRRGRPRRAAINHAPTKPGEFLDDFVGPGLITARAFLLLLLPTPTARPTIACLVHLPPRAAPRASARDRLSTHRHGPTPNDGRLMGLREPGVAAPPPQPRSAGTTTRGQRQCPGRQGGSLAAGSRTRQARMRTGRGRAGARKPPSQRRWLICPGGSRPPQAGGQFLRKMRSPDAWRRLTMTDAGR